MEARNPDCDCGCSHLWRPGKELGTGGEGDWPSPGMVPCLNAGVQAGVTSHLLGTRSDLSEALPPLRANLSSSPHFPVELACLRTFTLMMISRLRPAWLSDLLSPGDSSQEADHSSCLLSLTEGKYLPPSHGQPWC